MQVDKKQMDKILKYIEHGKREGATLVTGGKRIGNVGYYIEPTIFTNVKVCPLVHKILCFSTPFIIFNFLTTLYVN